MNIEYLRDYILAQKAVTEDNAFGLDFINFRLCNKIFACLNLERPEQVTLKCDADYALELRDQYQGITGAWHWNKKYWNDVRFDADVSDELVLKLVQHAMDEVLKKLPKKDRLAYEAL
ncbi:MAG: MmcQ/YjbR family DNA-binding protein [Paludibacter sp.]|nr:MmcQ/YjbR family DNA-binding protein [Bacteroidales bacterium]MCM1068604.1 MmcQ/YjbR family DNA-binding protein [Prevotella sp.]MCM1353268.1 MmcQ/YjbR family DNA-binding protein [Bacteroides sp.]MCM1442324.1 MmcQ/YjbR family DNA-binding protein [Muribaculum sp.]MCM1481143.1 MmcQ/YjbR family DNA-binding protein [Paludibacter sp.]